jgi:hypothetical protein
MLKNSKLEYEFSVEDVKKVFDFVIEYHLNPTKGTRGRTNQGKRGFGGELDEWLPGKLVEIATCRILERFGSGKELFPDFEIYSTREVKERSDPDITGVKDCSEFKIRKPNSFIEIKRIDDKAAWIGPRNHQLISMQKSSADYIGEYMIHTSIEFKDKKEIESQKGKLEDQLKSATDEDKTDIDEQLTKLKKQIKQQDITASFLKKLLEGEGNPLYEFSSIDNLVAQIEYVYSMPDLRKNGRFFKQGEIIPETEFPKSQCLINKDGSFRKGCKVVKEYSSGKHPLMMKIESSGEYVDYSRWTVSCGDGSGFLLIDNKGKEYLHCRGKVKLFNPLFGQFNLESNHTYRFFFRNKLGNGNLKNIDDIWLSKKRLDQLLENKEMPSTEESISKIMSEI